MSAQLALLLSAPTASQDDWSADLDFIGAKLSEVLVSNACPGSNAAFLAKVGRVQKACGNEVCLRLARANVTW